MRAASRLLLGLVCCVAGLVVSSSGVFAEGSSSLGGVGGSVVESPLVVPEAQGLVEDQGVREAEAARRRVGSGGGAGLSETA